MVLTSSDNKRPFKWFMITVEDPEVDNSIYEFDHRSVDVGSLKTLDTNRQSRYSERCYNSVENTDNSDKYRVEVRSGVLYKKKVHFKCRNFSPYFILQ